MKFIHTADWHLGKIVQGVHMTEDQAYVLDQFIAVVEEERPDAVIIAGDIYDRAVPPTEAVHLLDDVLKRLVIDLEIPVLAISGNHDSPGRIHFLSHVLKEKGLHLVGHLDKELEPIVFQDAYGDVHFHLIPYADPSTVRHLFKNDDIRNHDDAMAYVTKKIQNEMDENARHVFVGHAFVTPYGEPKDNESESEKTLAIGGTEYVKAEYFNAFHYTALGHLHRDHYVVNENIRYSGSLLKYSLSEEHHQKGFYIVELDEKGEVKIDKRTFKPRRDMRTVEATIEELYQHEMSEDYVFVHLLDEYPVLSPMEKVRTVYPNAMHVSRKNAASLWQGSNEESGVDRTKMDDLQLFELFYEEMTGEEPQEEVTDLFKEVLTDFTREDAERDSEREVDVSEAD